MMRVREEKEEAFVPKLCNFYLIRMRGYSVIITVNIDAQP